jgi:hypothetical protein
MNYFDIINECYELQKTIKPLLPRICKNCNKKMRIIKKDFLKRDYCKKCYFENEEERKYNNFVNNLKY